MNVIDLPSAETVQLIWSGVHWMKMGPIEKFYRKFLGNKNGMSGRWLMLELNPADPAPPSARMKSPPGKLNLLG